MQTSKLLQIIKEKYIVIVVGTRSSTNHSRYQMRQLTHHQGED